MSKSENFDKKPFSVNDESNSNSSSSTSVLSTMTRFKDYVSSNNNSVNSKRSRKISEIEMEMVNVELKFNEKSFQYVKTVGRGSFGVASLYKRLNDDTFVVLKQINLNELTNLEREMAMNEVDVFSRLKHPNVISYFSSFIRGETLYIEMEYADEGNLAQVINESTDYLPERYVLNVFEQMASAIAYMHGENILHRDLKTANIFLKRGIVKIGDFGISKIMNTKIHAQTILGTPYYFSPEMCEGKEYDEKSDIWAMGCILGEMCCRQKTFSASNLSELVKKIMAADFMPLPDGYSPQLKHLLKVLLQIDSKNRPSAKEILVFYIPLVYGNLGKYEGYSYVKIDDGDSESIRSSVVFGPSASKEYLEASTATMNDLVLTERSVLYLMKSFGSNFSLDPIQLPSTCKIRDVSVSDAHFLVVTEEGSVYGWGDGQRGQLGQNVDSTWKHFPTKIEALRRYNILSACAGDGFSIFLSNYGVVLSCGTNIDGCLGFENITSLMAPRAIDFFSEIKVTQIACDRNHVLVLDINGNVYSFGTNDHGALGIGKERCAMTPGRVELMQDIYDIKKIFCGPDCSLILLNNGSVYASGRNTCNRFGFGKNIGHVYEFKRISCLKKKVLDLSVSVKHSAFVVSGGYILTLGENSEGQLGLGHKKEVSSQPSVVKKLFDKFILKVKCASTYTIACTDTNVIMAFGTRFGIPEFQFNEMPRTPQTPSTFSQVGNNTAAFTNFLTSVYKSEELLEPVELLGVYSSTEMLEKGIYMKLINVFPLHHSMLVWVDTTTPLRNVH